MTEQQKEKPQSNILIVDDTPANLRLLTSILSKQNYEVRPIPNGKWAIEAAQMATPDLILLDIMMPEMDGFEVCRHLKSDKRTRQIPIIFISARDETNDKVMAFQVGGVDYITKPFQVEEVLARISTHLELHRLQSELETKNAELQSALDNIKTLKGLIPICANCKKIRDDDGFWHQVEVYIHEHSEASFSHGICPDCAKALYPEFSPKK